MERITSPQNSGVRRVARLRVKKGRDARGLTLVEGVREVRQALRSGLRFHSAYICREGVYRCPDDLVAELEAAQLRLYDASCVVFGKMAYGERTDGVLAVVDQPRRTLADLRLSGCPLVVVMESVEKPGNLGAVMRTCDAAGVDAIIVCDERTDPFNPNIVRASLGAAFTVPVAVASARDTLEFLRGRGIRVLAAVVEGEQDYFRADLTGPGAIVLGSEQDGLSGFWRSAADVAVRIPMCGKVDSLNVSVSAALLIYEAVRQRSHP